VYHDASHVKELTKKDMIEFFKHYISPDSPHRAKLAVHLLAQGTSAITGVEATVVAGVKELEISPKTEILANKVDSSAPSGTAANPYIIENVREFKSRLAVSAGPQPIKDLSEFEELDSKL
jgi:insulysin